MRRRTKLGASFLVLVACILAWRLSGGGAAQVARRDKAADTRKLADLRWDREHRPAAARALPTTNTAAAADYSPATGPATRRTAADCQRDCGSECDADGTCPKLCKADSDCPQARVCVPTPLGLWRCLASDCAGDDECGEDGTCAYEPHADRAVRRCSRAGDGDRVGVGAVCGAGKSCPKGTICADGMCLPTKCSTTGDCPKGSFCAELNVSPGSCPTCTGGESLSPRVCVGACGTDADCPHEMACRDVAGVGRKCAKKFDADCLAAGCAAGLECFRLTSGAEVVAECRKPCSGDGDTACGDGGLCTELSEVGGKKHNACMPSCKDDGDCGKGRTCRWHPGLPMGAKACLT